MENGWWMRGVGCTFVSREFGCGIFSVTYGVLLRFFHFIRENFREG